MKKIGLILCLGVVAAVILFFTSDSREYEYQGLENENFSTSKKEKTNIEKISESHKETRVAVDSQSDDGELATPHKKISNEEMNEIAGGIEVLELKWDDRLKNLFLNKLNLSQQDFEDYKVMRDGFEEDRLEAFENFHEEMAAKHGNSYRYSPTQEMKDHEGKIKAEYQDLFRKRFGESTYSQYISELESFNDEARKTSDPDLGVLYIDY